MPKSAPMPDVIVMGEHPAAYLCALLLRQKGALNVVHATLPHEHPPDRLVTINPEFFDLHKVLEPLKKKLKLSAVWGLQFVGDDANLISEPHRDKSVAAYVGTYRDVRAALEKLGLAEGLRCLKPKSVEVVHADESGCTSSWGAKRCTAEPSHSRARSMMRRVACSGCPMRGRRTSCDGIRFCG